MASITNKQRMIEILKMYRELPCLWDRRHRDFSNKYVRNQAYYYLLSMYQKVDQRATVKTLCKKIQNLKTNYFKELRKVQASKENASTTEKVYVPTLWYYEALSFLGAYYELPGNETIEIEDSDTSSDNEEHQQQFESTPEPKRSKVEPVTPKVESLPAEDTSTVQMKEEEWEVLGKSLAIQLRDINKKQLIITQKLISDTIFYAKMELLSNNSYIGLDRNDKPRVQHELPSTSTQRL